MRRLFKMQIYLQEVDEETHKVIRSWQTFRSVTGPGPEVNHDVLQTEAAFGMEMILRTAWPSEDEFPEEKDDVQRTGGTEREDTGPAPGASGSDAGERSKTGSN